MATRRLLVEVVGDDAALQRTLGRSGAAAEGFGAKVSAIGDKVSAVGKKLTTHLTLPVVAGFALSVHAAENLDKSLASLETALRKNGLEVDGNTAKVRAFAAAQAEYGVSQDQVIQGVARGVEFGGSLTKAMQGYQAALLISKATGKSFDSVQLAVNKTLGGSNTALSRYIGTIKKGTPLSEIFQRVHAKFAGQAKANSNAADQLKAKFANLFQNVGVLLLPAFERLVDFVTRLVDRFERLSPSTQKIILVALGLAAAIGPVVSIVGALASAIGFLIANPITLLIVGIGVLVAAIAAAVLWPDKLKAALERMGLSAQASGKVVADLRKVFEVVKQAGERLVAAVRAHWDTIKAVIKIAWDYISGTVRNGLQVVKGIFEVVSGLIHGDWSKVWQGIKDIVGGTLKQIGTELRAAVSLLGMAARAIGAAIWNGLKAGADAVVNWIVGKFNWIVGKLDWIKSKIGGLVGGSGIHSGGVLNPLNDIPHFASGGIVSRPTLALIGESGPEAVVPLGGGGAHHFASRMGGPGGGFGGGGVVMNFYGTYIGGKRQLEDEIVNGLSKWARRNGNTQLRAVLGVGT